MMFGGSGDAPGFRFFTLVLLLLFTYVFSVAFMQFSRGTVLEQKFFSSMGTAIWTLSLGKMMKYVGAGDFKHKHEDFTMKNGDFAPLI